MITACVLYAASTLAAASVLPLEVLYSSQSATKYYRLYDEDGSFHLLYASGAPSGRRRSSFHLTVEAYSVAGGDIQLLENNLSTSPISWNPDDYSLQYEEAGPAVQYNGLVRSGTNQVLASGIGAPATIAQSAASERAGQLVAALDRVKSEARIANGIDARHVLREALLDLLKTLPAGTVGGAVGFSIVGEERRSVSLSSVRACIAEMLVAGGLLRYPLQSTEPEIRLEGVSYYEAKLPEAQAFKALVSVLDDPVAAVRVDAASALAATVSEEDQGIRRKLEQLACDRNLVPLNDHLRGILQARKFVQDCNKNSAQ